LLVDNCDCPSGSKLTIHCVREKLQFITRQAAPNLVDLSYTSKTSTITHELPKSYPFINKRSISISISSLNMQHPRLTNHSNIRIRLSRLPIRVRPVVRLAVQVGHIQRARCSDAVHHAPIPQALAIFNPHSFESHRESVAGATHPPYVQLVFSAITCDVVS
jgi:hypothetical protein